MILVLSDYLTSLEIFPKKKRPTSPPTALKYGYKLELVLPINISSTTPSFPLNTGIAGHVALTGETLNVTDVGDDNRFNANIDQQVTRSVKLLDNSISLQTGYKTKSILCMPISIQGSVIGVMQMVNKNGQETSVFSTVDEEAFRVLSVYCGLALHYAKLYDKIRRSEQKLKVTLEVLSYHSSATAHDLAEVEEAAKLTSAINVPALAA